jgi:hypothetical protein
VIAQVGRIGSVPWRARQDGAAQVTLRSTLSLQAIRSDYGSAPMRVAASPVRATHSGAWLPLTYHDDEEGMAADFTQWRAAQPGASTPPQR